MKVVIIGAGIAGLTLGILLKEVFHHHPNSKGFGLFMTKTQVEAMGGRIWVESKPDEGSTFFIEFKNQHHDTHKNAHC